MVGLRGPYIKTTDVFDDGLFWAKDPPGPGVTEGLLRIIKTDY